MLLLTSGSRLSAAERMNLVTMLNGLPKHIGYIVIEHDLDVALKVAESVTIMHKGRFQRGSPSAIQDDPEVQASIWGKP